MSVPVGDFLLSDAESFSERAISSSVLVTNRGANAMSQGFAAASSDRMAA
jgi:hypothetical protein